MSRDQMRMEIKCLEIKREWRSNVRRSNENGDQMSGDQTSRDQMAQYPEADLNKSMKTRAMLTTA